MSVEYGRCSPDLKRRRYKKRAKHGPGTNREALLGTAVGELRSGPD